MNTIHKRLRWAVAALIAALVVTAGAAIAIPASAAEPTALDLANMKCLHTPKANGGFTLDCDPVTAPAPTSSPTAAPTTPAPSPSTTPPPSTGWPTATSVGVPADWRPATTYTNGLTIRESGTYSDIRVVGTLNIRALGVTLRRVEVVGGTIDNEEGGRCYGGLTVLDSTVRNSTASNGAIQPGGYTARRVALVDVGEGFRIGGRSDAGCGAVLIDDSYVRLLKPASVSCTDWHGDAVQGFDAPLATIQHSTLDARNNAGCGTAGVFYGSSETWGNQPLTVRGVLVLIAPGGTAYRPDTPHDTEGLRVFRDGGGAVLGTDQYGNYTCRRATRWVDNAIATADGTVVRVVTC